MNFVQQVDKKTITTILIVLAIVFSLGALVGFSLTKHYYKEKLDDITAQLTNYKIKYDATSKEKEQAIIDKAIAEAKAMTPVKEYIKGETQTNIIYKEKESPNDPSLKVTSPAPKVFAEFNGKRQELSSTNKEGMQIVDGQWVVTQQSSVVIDVTDTAKREMANIYLQQQSEIEKLKSENKTAKRDAGLVGFGIGILTGKLINN